MIRKKPRNKFEQSAWDWLKKRKIKFDYEGLKVPYKILANYWPDFWLPKQNLIIELKGYWRSGDKRKMASVKRDNPQLDIRIVFHPKAKESDIKWARKNGFPCAVGTIPEDWIK